MISRKTGKMSMTVLRVLLMVTEGIAVMSCASSVNTANTNPSEGTVISEMTTSKSVLERTDIVKFFCNSLTEYFNAYKFYKISSEVYSEKEKQSDNTTAKVTRSGNAYHVEYIGAAGRYMITFSNTKFSEAEDIFTFSRQTVLGNAIRSKVYDTFTAWVYKEEIALKANYNSYLFSQELSAAVEVENWFNRLSSSGEK
jgi:hypothetical protein